MNRIKMVQFRSGTRTGDQAHTQKVPGGWLPVLAFGREMPDEAPRFLIGTREKTGSGESVPIDWFSAYAFKRVKYDDAIDVRQ